MADLIDRQVAMLEIERRYRDYRQRSEKPVGNMIEVDIELQMAALAVKGCLDFMHDISAVDAMELVRCGSPCRWLYDGADDYCCTNHKGLAKITPDSYCCYGERGNIYG